MSDEIETVTDDQTGHMFKVVPERWFDIVAAWISIGYSLFTIAYLGWLLLDTWTAQYSAWFLKPFLAKLNSRDTTIFNLLVYTAAGGGMGAAVNNIRSFVQWHAERKAFGWRFVWKYVSLPPLGATLAVMVYAIIRSGIAVFSGSFSGTGTITSFSAWATGTLAGYGSHKVFIWLDDKVSSMFQVEGKAAQPVKVAVPDVSGKTQEEAAQILQEAKLVLGKVSDEQTSDSQKIGKVVSQTPAAGTQASSDTRVNITIGTASGVGMGSPATKVRIPDVSGKTQEQAAQTLQESRLAIGAVSEGRTTDGQMIGKVINQVPAAGTEIASESKVDIIIGTPGNP